MMLKINFIILKIIINGTQAMTSVASLAVLEAYKLIRFSKHNLAMTYEALTGIDDVFFDKKKSLWKLIPKATINHKPIKYLLSAS